MDINLPLILLIAVALTGIIYLLDVVVLSKKRKRAAQTVEQDFSHLSDQQKQADPGYCRAVRAAAKEPALVEYSKSFFPILAVVFVLRSFLVEPFKIPSESMVPTLEVGDFIAVNKFEYGIRLPVIRLKIFDINQPERGDVVVFFPPNEDRYFIKRLIGLSGDTIRYANHQLYVNGEAVPQELVAVDELPRSGGACSPGYQIMNEVINEHSFLTRKCLQPGRLSQEGTWVVPDGHYFMMGDNRDNSLDSRGWSDPFVPDKNIVGKAFAVWMHWGDSLLPSFHRTGAIE